MLAWAVHGILDDGSLSLTVGFWSKVAKTLGVVAIVLGTAGACVGTVGTGCAFAIAAAAAAIGAFVIFEVTDESGNVLKTEGTLQYRSECPYENVCDVTNIAASNPQGRAMVAFDVTSTTIRNPSFTAHGVSYCPGVTVTAPASGSNIGACFTLTTLPSGTRLYQNEEYWFDGFTGAGYQNFVCAASIGVEVIVTWSNGNRAAVATSTAKQARLC